MSSRALFWNSVSGTALYAMTVAVSFSMSPFLVRRLGDGGYGFWELVLGLVGYLGILDLGVGPAVVRYVALAASSGDRTRLAKVVNAGFATFLVAGFVGALVIALVALKPDVIFGDVPVSLRDARLAIGCAALLFLFTFTRATFSASLMGLQYHRIVNTTRIVTALGQAVAIYLLLCDDKPHALVRVAAVATTVTFLETIFFAVVLRMKLPAGYRPFSASWKEGRDLFGFGAKSAGLMASSSLVRQGILFVLAHGPGAAAVTIYVLAGRLVDYGQQLAFAIGFPMAPYLTAAFGSGGLEGAKLAWLSTTRVMQFIQSGIAMGLICLGLPFLARWMGPEYAVKGAGAFYFLCGAALFTVVGANANRMLVSLNQHGRAAIAALVIGVVSLAAAYVLSLYYGLVGAAAGACAFGCALNLIELVLACRALKLSVAKQIIWPLRRNLLPVLAGASAMTISARVVPTDTYVGIAVNALCGSCVYVTVSVFTALSASERQRLWGGMVARFSSGR
jgi:O-antigen/teichoic acid export membrane protein